MQPNIIIQNNNGTILEFPNGTLLCSIFPDLWNEIIKYMDYYPFVLGYDATLGYRILKRTEFDKEKFLDYYFKNGGILNTENTERTHLLTIDGYMISSLSNNDFLGCERGEKTIITSIGMPITQNYPFEISNIKVYYSEILNIMVPDI
jgi:hypothetical protein